MRGWLPKRRLMDKITISRKCVKDLDSIFDYVAASSPKNSEMLVRLLQDRFRVLARHPGMGRLRPELAENLRSWNVHRFVVFYLQTVGGIEIARVLHAAMDIGLKHFSDR